MKLDELKEVVASELGVAVEELTEDTKFVDDLGADSLDLFQLAMALEEKFEIEIPSEDLEKIMSVGDALKYIEEKLA
ncbi:acyl carrier protein [Anaeromicropila populeti]|uniref:Acyl carrier protein n=1 Tax=Anaeromicropila populeti TaxID=37658 RepID=A0A1I6LAD4_9FIRM|nr:acyl carrier protein [Anaeromicropila populeti]SFS00433.1 acyl carrier protein [Anaeromicropila populeti]